MRTSHPTGVGVTAGRSRQEFPDVSARIRPETVTLSGNGFGIVEQNFDYDLLSPAALMEKAVGQTVTLLRTNPATGAETRERRMFSAACDKRLLSPENLMLAADIDAAVMPRVARQLWRGKQGIHGNRVPAI